MTSIDGGDVFRGCSNLSTIEVEDGNTYYHADSNCLIETASNTLIRACGIGSIVIPNSVTSIGNSAFSACTNLSSVTIPNSVTSIGAGAFYECTNLSSVTIPNSVTSIGAGAFYECTNLSSVTIPNSVTSIGSNAFFLCTGLKEVTLLYDKLPECSTYDFYWISSDATLYCKWAVKKECASTDTWSSFTNIVATDVSIAITDAGIATACYDEDLDFTELDAKGVKAYIASGFNPDEGKVLLTRVMQIPAGTGFIVKGAEGTYDIPVSPTKYMYANLFLGTLEYTTLQASDSYTNYVLGNGDDGVGFYLPSADYAIPAYKAYLQIPTSTAAARRSIGISFEDEDDTTTGFISISELKEGADGTSAIYDIYGQRKSGLTKGLNIVDGKKIYIR